MDKSNLGTRMKTYYEEVPKLHLYRRTPVAIRIDGKAFHTFTRGFQKPFDKVLGNAMARTMEYLCKNIQGCVFGYTQSDEITLILIDYQTFETSAWFDYEIQKLCSVSASMATMAFNKFFENEINRYFDIENCMQYPEEHKPEDLKLIKTYCKASDKGAMFDARCFNIPKEEVCNLVYWRQLDATRNSIQMVGQANFSHTELQNKTCNEIQDMLHEQRGINWNDYEVRWKRGVACRKVVDYVETKGMEEKQAFGDPLKYTVKIAHFKWEIDWDMPILKGEDRAYIDNLIYVGN